MKTFVILIALLIGSNTPPVFTSIERYYRWTTWPIMWGNGSVIYMQMRPSGDGKGVETNIMR